MPDLVFWRTRSVKQAVSLDGQKPPHIPVPEVNGLPPPGPQENGRFDILDELIRQNGSEEGHLEDIEVVALDIDLHDFAASAGGDRLENAGQHVPRDLSFLLRTGLWPVQEDVPVHANEFRLHGGVSRRGRSPRQKHAHAVRDKPPF